MSKERHHILYVLLGLASAMLFISSGSSIAWGILAIPIYLSGSIVGDRIDIVRE